MRTPTRFPRNRRWTWLANWFLCTVCLCLPLRGLANDLSHGLQNSNYYFDFLTFKSFAGDSALLEVFCQIPVQQLRFANVGEKWVSRYQVVFRVSDLQGHDLIELSKRDSILVPEHSLTAELANPLLRFAALLRPGNYLATFQLSGMRAANCVQLQKKITIPDYSGTQLQMSDLQLASSITNTTDEGVLVKNFKKIIPNVSHIFGQPGNLLNVYSELYNLCYAANKPGRRFSATYAITDKIGNEVKRLQRIFDKPGDTCAYGIGIPISDLQTGAYTLTLIVEDLDSRQMTSKSVRFHVLRPASVLTEAEFRRTLRQLRYIATEKQLHGLSVLPPGQRLQGLQEFWESMDPVPETKENELMIEFYNRLYYSNQYFDSSDAEGWESDRGKVYIKNGPPDAVEKVVPEQQAGNVYEIWEYQQLNRKYIFVDSWGVGNFRLFRTASNSDSPDYSLFQQD